MGGYGAFKIAMSRPERFSMAAALSGVMDVTLYGEKPEHRHIFGDTIRGTKNDLFTLARELRESGKPLPKLFQWCGTEDALYPCNVQMRDHLRALGYSLTYSESHGNHSWDHWDEQIKNVLGWIKEHRG